MIFVTTLNHGNGGYFKMNLDLDNINSLQSLYFLIGVEDGKDREIFELLQRERLLKQCGRCTNRGCRQQTVLLRNLNY